MLVLVVAYGTVGKVVAPKDYKHINDVFQAVGLHVVVNRTDFEDFLATLTLDVVVNGEVDKVVAPEHKNEVESILISLNPVNVKALSDLSGLGWKNLHGKQKAASNSFEYSNHGYCWYHLS